jgi:dolichyl-phosphate-mannose-protein mannosyltransferase
VAFAAIAFLVLRHRHPERWRGLGPAKALALLGLGSAGAYLITFLPTFSYANQPMTLARLIPFQLDMLHQQLQTLPPHHYQSDWWTWAIMKRPIWYLYEPADGAQRGILMLGNPAIMWTGLVAVVACLWAWARHRDTRAGAIAAVWIASYAMWAVIPKSLGFFYYYYLSSIWLALVIAAALDHWRARLRYWDEALLLASAILFIRFYPILAATALPGPDAFHRWTWFSSWV